MKSACCGNSARGSGSRAACPGTPIPTSQRDDSTPAHGGTVGLCNVTIRVPTGRLMGERHPSGYWLFAIGGRCFSTTDFTDYHGWRSARFILLSVKLVVCPHMSRRGFTPCLVSNTRWARFVEVDPVRGGGAVRLAAVHAAFEGVGVEGVFRHGREVFSRPSRSQKSSRKCWPDPRSWPPDFDQSAMSFSICSAVGSRMPGESLDRGGMSRRGWFPTGHQQGGRPETAQSLTCLNLRISGKQSP